MFAPYFLNYLNACALAAFGDANSLSQDSTPVPAGSGSTASAEPPRRPSSWRRFNTWFKQRQRDVNDWFLVPLMAYVFLTFPYWLARQTDGPIINFPPSYLSVPVFGVLLVVVSFGFAWNFLHVQFPDEYQNIRNFRARHVALTKQLRTCADAVQATRLEFQLVDSWKTLKYSLLLLLSFFVAALLASVAALIVA